MFKVVRHLPLVVISVGLSGVFQSPVASSIVQPSVLSSPAMLRPELRFARKALGKAQPPGSSSLHQQPQRVSTFWGTGRPRRRIVRSGGICQVGPGTLEGDNKIWSDRPLFIWQVSPPGDYQMQELEVVTFTPGARSETRLMEVALTPQESYRFYQGSRALEPGTGYQWGLRYRWMNRGTNRWEVEPPEDISREQQRRDYFNQFTTMTVAERATITQELEAIAATGRQRRATPEQIANDQATALEERGMWSDMLQILYSVENASPETRERREGIVSYICAQRTESAASSSQGRN